MKRFMVIAGEASGDLLAAELVMALKKVAVDTQPESQLEFFGAGGPAMQQAGVQLAFDMTAHAVVGLVEVIRNYAKFRRLFQQLLDLALSRKPDAIICVDFGGFNRRFAHAVREQSKGANWSPRLIQYVSPQVWASRPGRAQKMARDFDLLLTIFPFETEWYRKRLPDFHVEFVGHPIVDRYMNLRPDDKEVSRDSFPLIALLPGSRLGELARHLPVMRDVIEQLAKRMKLRWRIVVPQANLAETARRAFAGVVDGEVQVADLANTLREADLAIASTGTVTLECAWFGVPTVAIYKTSWGTYQVGKRIIHVRFLAMPNLLADREIFPELIQNAATGRQIAQAVLGLWGDAERRKSIQLQLRSVVDSLGSGGASDRAAKAIFSLFPV